MPRIEPTVGRIVHFRPGTNDQQYVGDPGGEPLAAIVAKVLGPDRINLCVFTDKGHAIAMLDVPLVQEGEAHQEAVSYAEWMPYQKGQAAKTEKLEAQIAGSGANSGAALNAASETTTGPSSNGAGNAAAITPRELDSHRVNPTNDTLKIEVTDAPGAGGANHRYVVSGFDVSRNPSAVAPGDNSDRMTILFQNGPIAEAGVNGITQEVLLAVVMDRLQAFQRGPYACEENAMALTSVDTALQWLQERTRARMSRGVEGTQTV